MEPLSIGEKVLGQAEQGALLSWTEALESGQLPTRWPINIWFALFLLRLNKGWGALLISHMSDAPLQQDDDPQLFNNISHDGSFKSQSKIIP